MYAGLGETAIDYYPQKGLYTAISYAFTDLILLASMLVLALLLVRQERDSGLLSAGAQSARWTSAHCAGKAGLVCPLIAGCACVALRRKSRLLCCHIRFGSADPHDSECARLNALYHADHGWAVSVPLSASQVGWGLCHGALGHAGGVGCPPSGCRMGCRPSWAARDVRHPCHNPGYQPAECHQIRKPCQPTANQRAVGELPQSVLVR